MDKLKIIDEINNAEWSSFGDPLYSYDQVEGALNKMEELTNEEKEELYNEGADHGVINGLLFGVFCSVVILWMICFLTNSHLVSR